MRAELGSSSFPQARLCRQARWDLASDGRWRAMREVVLRLLRDHPVQLLSRQLGASGSSSGVRKPAGSTPRSSNARAIRPVQAELDSAMKRIGELTSMQVEDVLEAKTETFGPLGRRRSRRCRHLARHGSGLRPAAGMRRLRAWPAPRSTPSASTPSSRRQSVGDGSPRSRPGAGGGDRSRPV